ncbi:hypothetical protein, partial [Streptomyces sp. 12257]|uniref:hypothetical protein n=1 Tax=Streptomyces sp. 12257 TaxID=3041009 RepID=UPI0024A85877
MDSTSRRGDGQSMTNDAASFPEDLVDGILRIAEETGVTPETLHLAAQFRVIGWVVGFAEHPSRDESWRELVLRTGTDAGRAEAERARQRLG